jgi:hypothetical protein
LEYLPALIGRIVLYFLVYWTVTRRDGPVVRKIEQKPKVQVASPTNQEMKTCAHSLAQVNITTFGGKTTFPISLCQSLDCMCHCGHFENE